MAQGGYRQFAQQRVPGRRLFAHARHALLHSCTLPRALRIQWSTGEIVGPVLYAQAHLCGRHAVAVLAPAACGGGHQQAEAEDCTAMGVDTPGGSQHRSFGSEAGMISSST